jgi:hypothetical protein
MTAAFAIAGLSAMLAFGAPACAQFVHGNEAVLSAAAGKKVLTPPLPSTGTAMPLKLCPAQSDCHAGPWHMVETDDGLVECTEPYARPGTCRPSTYGTQKIPRLWIVKAGARWLWCQHPDLRSKCIDMAARPPANLPFPAVQ